jgi:2-dehydropantoate 2-reductase
MGIKVAVVGAGALGSAFAALLFESGTDVVLLSERKDHVELLVSQGLEVSENATESRIVKVPAAFDINACEAVDLAIVLVKSTQTAHAVERILPILKPNSAVLSLQNGVGNEEIITDAVGESRVIGGKTYVGSVSTGPGQISIGLAGKTTVIGEFDGSTSTRIADISELFNRARIVTHATTNILGAIWDKLLVNVATGAISAITGLPYGDLYQIQEIRQTVFRAVDEAIEVADSIGVHLSIRDTEVIWNNAKSRLAPDFKASMLQSIEACQPTEIDVINGAVVRLGNRYGVPTPVNQAFVAAVKGIEWRQRLENTRSQKPNRIGGSVD